MNCCVSSTLKLLTQHSHIVIGRRKRSEYKTTGKRKKFGVEVGGGGGRDPITTVIKVVLV